ncbi:site-specific integrase [soil metagenome]
MSDRSVGFTGPLASLDGGFEAELRRLGYSAGARRRQLRLLAELSAWMGSEGLGAAALSSERVAVFLQLRRLNGRDRFVSLMGLGTLLGYLRAAGGVPEASRPAAVGPSEVVLDRYRCHLIEDRGLADAVVAQYETGGRLFADFAASRGRDLAEVNAADVSAFVAHHCARPVKLAAPELVTILRGLLRFLYVEGIVILPLAQAVPAVASWRAAALPKALPAGVPTRLLDSCDRTTAAGLRDYAMLMLLVRLGLRSGEIVAMRLEDFEWRAGEVVIRGKGRRHERMPLPAEVGDAVVGYLRAGRPRTECRVVFLRTLAPLVGLSRASVTQVVYAACGRAGVPRASAHRLRHTLATDLLQAGSSLGEIGQVLRHRSISTTALYAKVDHDALATLARPWPGGRA